jgi:hemin uptake protein HemP
MNLVSYPTFGSIRTLFRKSSKRKLVIYHRGYLYVDRTTSEDLHLSAKYILRKAQAGECMLFQRRNGDFDYTYYFCKI